MRLVSTQAKVINPILDKAVQIIVNAIKTRNFAFLQMRLEKELGVIPYVAMRMVEELALYEAQFTTRQLVKHKVRNRNNIVKLSEAKVTEIVPQIKIKTSTQSTPKTITETYKSFAQTKATQYTRIVSDAQVLGWDDEETVQAVQEKTDGLFSAQNLVLAGLVMMGTANYIRNEVSSENELLVDWTLDLELNNCEYCMYMADNSPYNPSEVEGEIPVHGRCGCTLVPVEDSTDE